MTSTGTAGDATWLAARSRDAGPADGGGPAWPGRRLPRNAVALAVAVVVAIGALIAVVAFLAPLASAAGGCGGG